MSPQCRVKRSADPTSMRATRAEIRPADPCKSVFIRGAVRRFPLSNLRPNQTVHGTFPLLPSSPLPEPLRARKLNAPARTASQHPLRGQLRKVGRSEDWKGILPFHDPGLGMNAFRRDELSMPSERSPLTALGASPHLRSVGRSHCLELSPARSIRSDPLHPESSPLPAVRAATTLSAIRPATTIQAIPGTPEEPLFCSTGRLPHEMSSRRRTGVPRASYLIALPSRA